MEVESKVALYFAPIVEKCERLEMELRSTKTLRRKLAAALQVVT